MIKGDDEHALALKRCATTNVSRYYSAAIPPNGSRKKSEWFNDWLKKSREETPNGDILKENPFTKKGKRNIATFFGVDEQHWMEWDSDTVKPCDGYYAFMKCLADHKTRNYIAIDPSEGLQRFVGLAVALTGRDMDPSTGTILDLPLTLQSIQTRIEDVKAVDEAEPVSIKERANQWVMNPKNAMLYESGSKKSRDGSGLKPKFITIQVYSATARNASGADIMKNRTAMSLAKSDDRRTSASANVFHVCGVATTKLCKTLLSVNPDSINYNPNYEDEEDWPLPNLGRIKQRNRFNEARTALAKETNVPEEDVDPMSVESAAYDYNKDVLEGPEWDDYKKNPFDASNIEPFVNSLAVAPHEESTVSDVGDPNPDLQIGPPYVPSWKARSILPETRTDPKLMVNNKNDLLLLPVLVHLLVPAAHGDTTFYSSERTKEKEDLCSYYAKYFINCLDNVTSLDIHEAWELVYGKVTAKTTKYTSNEPMLGAIQLLLTMFNAIIASKCDDPTHTEDERMNAFNQGLAEFELVLQKIDSKDTNAVEKALAVLGESIFVYCFVYGKTSQLFPRVK